MLECIRWIRRASGNIFNYFKKIVLIPYGLRAEATSVIAFSARVDGGGSGGRIFIGPYTHIDVGVIMRAYGGIIRIGEYCSVNAYTVIQGGGTVEIGDNVRIAPHCTIFASNHNFHDRRVNIREQGINCVGIIIGDDVWLGAGSRIMDGVTIGRGSVVAAGAVVTKSVSPYSVVGGVPARLISIRGGVER